MCGPDGHAEELIDRRAVERVRAAHLARRWLAYNAHILGGGHAGSGYSAGLTPGDADATRRLEAMFGEVREKTGSLRAPSAAVPTSSMPLSFGWFGAWIGEVWDSMLVRSAPGTPRTGGLWSRTKRRLSGDRGRDARSVAVRL